MTQPMMNLPEIISNNQKIKLKKYKPYKRSIQTERWYFSELKAFVKSMREQVESAVKNPHFFSPLITDSDDAETARQAVKKAVNALANRKVDEMAKRLSDGFVARGKAQHDREFSQRIEQATGIDIKSYLGTHGKVSEKLTAYTEANVQLIKSIQSQYLDKIQSIVTMSATRGGSVKDLTTEIKKIGDVTDKRAKFIARDQTAKFNSSLDQAQYENLGITHYRWSTSGDERVRESHAENDGKVFALDNPPPTGHCGEDFNCRCVMLPLFDKNEIKQALAEQKGGENKSDLMPEQQLKTLIGKQFDDVTKHLEKTEVAKAIEQYKLSKAEAISIIGYTGELYRSLNTALRLDKATEVQKTFTRQLNKALDKLPNYIGKTYRIAKLDKKALLRYAEKAIVTEYAFTSTTKNKKLKTFSGNVKFVIKGKTGKDIENISLYKNEREVLFKNGKRFYIEKIQEKGFWIFKKKIIYLIEVK
ncbi:phage minor head protein [Lonepinella koalarum]|uniref:phage minor head protein n=1 Tax=Lonepinella koalarum TaxID=53417 RepID=UPI003F6E1BA2